MTKYTDINAVNFSTLKAMGISPKEYKHQLDALRKDKPAWAVGRLVHCLILEPEAFQGRYAVTDKLPPDGWRNIYVGEEGIHWATCTAKVRRGKVWDALEAEYEGHAVALHTAPEVAAAEEFGDAFRDAEEIVTPTMVEQARAMADSVHAHDEAAKLLVGGRAEETVTWTDEATGLDCKGRLDYITPGYLVDLKTTRNIIPRLFRRDVANFEYHAQLAWYHDGAVVAGVLPPDAELPWLIAVQNVAPWDVVVYRMTAEDMAAGRARYRQLMNRLLSCMEANWWPGVAPGVLDLEVPGWAPGMDGEDEEKEEEVL